MIRNNKTITNKLMSNPRGFGFTLIELLVVVAIIGLLASIISVSLTSSRIKARDTKRISQMKQLKTGLDLYFSYASGYPPTTTWNSNVGQLLQCSGTDILIIPNDPIAPTFTYNYIGSGASSTGCGGTVVGAYEIQFYIEKQGRYYIMNQDGALRDAITGTPLTFDSLL